MRRIALLFCICYLVIVSFRYKDICNCIRVSSVIREFYLDLGKMSYGAVF